MSKIAKFTLDLDRILRTKKPSNAGIERRARTIDDKRQAYFARPLDAEVSRRPSLLVCRKKLTALLYVSLLPHRGAVKKGILRACCLQLPDCYSVVCDLHLPQPLAIKAAQKLISLTKTPPETLPLVQGPGSASIVTIQEYFGRGTCNSYIASIVFAEPMKFSL